MSDDSRATQIRVGVFLMVGMVMAGAAILALGQSSGLFEGKITVDAYFQDVSGLVSGAPVRLAGVDVGTVKAIEFDALPSTRTRVLLAIKSKYAERLRRDSTAVIDSKGLLGDKLINISMGTAAAPPISDGATLASRAAPSFEQLSGKLDQAVTAITKVAQTADATLQQLGSDDARRDLARILSSTAALLETAERGSGVAHRIFYDPRYGEDVEGIMSAARHSLTEIGAAAQRAEHVLAGVDQGEGFAHELIHGKSGRATMVALRDAATEIASISGAVAQGDGLLHALIYDPEQRRALDELSQAATRINGIVANIERGQGTIGGLLVDPTPYEDLTTMLGNINRNVLLKALIRFTVKKGDIQRPANTPVKQLPR